MAGVSGSGSCVAACDRVSLLCRTVDSGRLSNGGVLGMDTVSALARSRVHTPDLPVTDTGRSSVGVRVKV